jgi:hypothetical protein
MRNPIVRMILKTDIISNWHSSDSTAITQEESYLAGKKTDA